MAIWTKSEKAGYCYAISYRSKLIKIGRTKAPRDRMRSHINKATIKKDPIQEMYLTMLVDNCGSVEQEILDRMTMIAQNESLEVFRGAEMHSALSILRKMKLKPRKVRNIYSLKGAGVYQGSGGWEVSKGFPFMQFKNGEINYVFAS